MIERNRNRIRAMTRDRGPFMHALLAGMAVAALVAVVGIAQAQAQEAPDNPPTTSERYEKVRDAEQEQQDAKGQYEDEYGIEYDRNPLHGMDAEPEDDANVEKEKDGE